MTTQSRKTTGWVLTSFIIAFLLFDSIGKIIGLEESVKATLELGYPENLISTIGFILLILTILFSIPRTSILGAILLTSYLGGAVASNFRIESPLFSRTMFPAYIAVIAWLGFSMRNENIILLLKPTCIKYTNTYVYNFQSCAVPCLPTGGIRPLK